MTATAELIRSFSIASSDDELFRALPGASPAEIEQIHALLVSRHSGLVRWMASRYSGRGVAVDELRQIGYVGLMLAIGRFDVDRGHDFAAFAGPTVQGEIRRYFRDRRRWIRLPRRLQELKAALRLAEEGLAQSLGHWPTDAELAASLGVTEDEVREAMAADETYDLPSLDAPTRADGGRALTLADAIAITDPRLELIDDLQSVRPLIAQLPLRDQQILRMCYFEDRTQKEVGKQLGISQMHVSRLLARTVDRLRAGLEAAPAARRPVLFRRDR